MRHIGSTNPACMPASDSHGSSEIRKTAVEMGYSVMRKPVLTSLLILWICASAAAQPIGTWRYHTSPLVVQNVVGAEDGRWWASTTGGLVHRQQDGSVVTYSKADGLYALNATALTYDAARNLIWLGYADGTYSRLEPGTSQIRTYTDIQRSDRFLTKQINRIHVAGPDLLLATDFGVVRVNASNGLVRDTYAHFGSFNPNIRGADAVVWNQVLVVATEQGLAFGDPARGDLLVSSNWTTVSSESVRSLGLNGETLYVSLSSGNYQWIHSQLTPIGIWPEPVRSFERMPGGALIGLSATMAVIVESDGRQTTLQLPDGGGNLVSVYRSTGEIVFGYRDRGIVRRSGGEDRPLGWSGPYLNVISQLVFHEGSLLVASSSAPNQFSIGLASTGYSIFRDGRWTNVNRDTDPFMRDRNVNAVYRAAANETHYFFGTYGNGIIRRSISDGTQVHYNRENSNLPGFELSPEFIIASGLGSDSKGDVWASILANITQPLARYDRASETWVRYPVSPNAGSSSQYVGLTIDSFDQKWIPLYTATLVPRGVLVAAHEADGTERSFRMTSNDNEGALPDDHVRAVVQDQRGEVWVGTDRGVARFLFPDRIISGTAQERRGTPLINEDPTVADRLLLRDVRITALAVDPSNRKWVGTAANGLWLLNENGGRVLQHFTAENSPLLSNAIVSLAIDPVTGEVFVATDAGLLSYLSDSRAGERTMSELTVYPNPFRYGEAVTIIIDGLKDRSAVTVLSVDGFPVARFESRGGRAQWNGLDASGNRLATGIYTVVATHASGQRASGKILVIR